MSSERAVANTFDLGGAVVDIAPFGHGLINDTFLVTTAAGHAVLQRINRRAFPHPELIMQNLRLLADHIGGRRLALRVPTILPARDGKDYVIDADGGFWRAMSYVENTVTFDTISNLKQAEEVGTALGRFHALASGLDPERLHVTRPGFHQTPQYYARFVEAAAGTRATDADMQWCLTFAESRAAIVSVLEDARRDGRISLRGIHGDPKLNNFLFDRSSGRVASLIDLDTLQPGLVHYDIGDCLRSSGNPAGESPANLGEVRFDLDICRAILTHYLTEARTFLTPNDQALLYDAIRLIPLELGLRFLTDHLLGDVYFKIEWRGQNLHRALVQFRLTADIEKNEPHVRSLIAELGG